MGAREVGVVHAIYEAINARDLDRVVSLLDDDVEVTTTVESFRGHDGGREWLRRTDEIFDGYQVHVAELIDGGDRVLAHTHQTARGRGSGVEIGHRISHVWELRDGRVTAMRAYVDPSAARAAAGLDRPFAG